MTIIRVLDDDGTLVAKAFPNQEEGLRFYVRAGMEDRYFALQNPKLLDCPIEVLSLLPGEKPDKPERIPAE
jgi:hypothetical protein